MPDEQVYDATPVHLWEMVISWIKQNRKFFIAGLVSIVSVGLAITGAVFAFQGGDSAKSPPVNSFGVSASLSSYICFISNFPTDEICSL